MMKILVRRVNVERTESLSKADLMIMTALFLELYNIIYVAPTFSQILKSLDKPAEDCANSTRSSACIKWLMITPLYFTPTFLELSSPDKSSKSTLNNMAINFPLVSHHLIL